jgi:hypothetical protein
MILLFIQELILGRILWPWASMFALVVLAGRLLFVAMRASESSSTDCR